MRLPNFFSWNYSCLKLLILAFILTFSGNTIAQQRITSFPEDPIMYLSSLEQHFTFVQKSKEDEAKEFIPFIKSKWQSGVFSDEIKTQIYKTSNKMLSKDMSAIPYFKDYFTTLIHLIEGSNNYNNIRAWMNSVHYILDNKSSREFTTFIRASDDFFTQNLVFHDSRIKWKVSTNNYLITFQNDTLKYEFPQTNLVCYTKGDSTNIFNTKGQYFPLSNTWLGEKGKIFWSRANYSMDSVYAELNQYSIPLTNSKFTADSVQFTHLTYFDKPIIGRLEEQVMSSRRGNRAIYPKFVSYEKRWKIPDIFQNIDFTGGILIEGAKVLGFGDDDTPATLTINRNDTTFIKLRSKNFNITSDQILSAYTSLSIFYKNDSIYHSGLHMNYTNDNQMLSFYRDDHGLTANPFYDTYHELNMFVEAVYWKMDENKLSFDMTMGRTKTPARFESFNYFSEDHFNKLQGIDDRNPLVSLKDYSEANRSNIIYFDEYADYLHMPLEQVKLLLLNMAHQGFLLYNADKGNAVLGDKIDFYLKAKRRDIDSDVIRFDSKPRSNEANANLQIDNFDLQVNGLNRIILSDSQNLIIEPTNRSIVFGKNKNFSFDGKITAGRITFATSQSSFNYDEFKLDMPTIDSLWFWVEGEPLPSGGYERKYVQSTINNLSGDLLIDHPDNKSGSEAHDKYPIFTSKKDSYVYYDKKSIQNGVYLKERFYFHVNPFTFSALNDFNTDDIAFEGYLASSGIFPDITYALTVQDDYSLGFIKTLPAEGVMAYGDKGKYYNEISLSNQGLRGNGELRFINSTTTSDEFVFLPNSMNAYAQTFDLLPTTSPVEFPRVNGLNTYQQWFPYQETMEISSTTEDLKMYDDETTLAGTIVLRPSSLSGKGNMQFRLAKMSSDAYVFKNQTFSAEKTNFEDVGMVLNNFSAQADFTKRTVIFGSNDGSSKVDFPDNLYICYMNEAKWYMDEELTEYASSFEEDQSKFEDLTLRQLAETEYKGSIFISTHPRQDSLLFYSALAKFNANDKIIEAEGVRYIKVADAAIFPEHSKVTIMKNAEMGVLKNAEIITNIATKYHEINNANVKIESRKSYIGSGDYVYVDKNMDKHPIHFKEIKVDSDYQTIAKGEIFAEDNFPLSPNFYFRGIVNLAASRKLLEYQGGFRINNDCTLGTNWIKFTSVIDPENVIIPIAPQPIVPDISRQRKYVGILNSPARGKIYSAFLSNKIDYYDSLLISAHGAIKYDDETKEFRISSEEKLNQMALPDNYYSLSTTDCSTYGEGKVNLDVNFIDLSMKSFGNIQLKESQSLIHIGAAINFHFSINALEHIANQFKRTSTTQVDNSSPYYLKMLAGFMGMDEAEQYLSRQIISNQRSFPEKLKYTIFLTDLKLKWNPDLSAYISEGKIGIGYLDKYLVNGLVNGKVEVKKSRAGDELTIYFEINDQWYFFKYYNNVMQVLSSNETFNEMIRSDMDSKREKNRLKLEEGTLRRSNYRYILSKDYVKEEFLNRVNTN